MVRDCVRTWQRRRRAGPKRFGRRVSAVLDSVVPPPFSFQPNLARSCLRNIRFMRRPTIAPRMRRANSAIVIALARGRSLKEFFGNLAVAAITSYFFQRELD
jgi:hypothetical protein